MRDIVKRYAPDMVLECFRYIKLKKRLCEYEKEIEKRSKLSIFDYNELAIDMPYVTREKFQNSFYGLDGLIKKYAGLDETDILDGMIEHGLYLDNSINPIEISGNNLWTLSEERRQYLGKYMDISKVHAVGPYIIYADDFYDGEKISILKRKFGKTLLVFPTHSTHWIDVTYDIDDFIKEIKRVRDEHEFNTVLVSMYWKDILNGRATFYKKEGFLVCTSGHIFDKNFMSRQKTIIKLSDVCMGNRIGTHVGYCIALGKPYYAYGMKTNNKFYGKQVCEEVYPNYDYKRELERLLYDNFGDYHEEISDKNLAFVKKYWGDF